MTKRLIDTTARELASYKKQELLTSIADSEGRTLAAETIGTVTPMLVDITNAEFVTSLGADLIMLNVFDVNEPVIQGLPNALQHFHPVQDYLLTLQARLLVYMDCQSDG